MKLAPHSFHSTPCDSCSSVCGNSGGWLPTALGAVPTWLHIPGCLALGEWSHHHDYLGHEDLFLYSPSCHLFLISSASVSSVPSLGQLPHMHILSVHSQSPEDNHLQISLGNPHFVWLPPLQDSAQGALAVWASLDSQQSLLSSGKLPSFPCIPFLCGVAWNLSCGNTLKQLQGLSHLFFIFQGPLSFVSNIQCYKSQLLHIFCLFI